MCRRSNKTNQLTEVSLKVKLVNLSFSDTVSVLLKTAVITLVA